MGRGGENGPPPEIEIGGATYPLQRYMRTDSVVVDGLTYRAEARFVTDSVVWIHTRLHVFNGTEREAGALYGSCPPIVRVYLDEQRAGRPIWDEAFTITGSAKCDSGGKAVRLRPGEVRQLHHVAVAPRRLKAFLPPRQYYLGVVFWVSGRGYEVAAGHEELTS
jgi:hypothetical protein